jgi:hypothetical protein
VPGIFPLLGRRRLPCSHAQIDTYKWPYITRHLRRQQSISLDKPSLTSQYFQPLPNGLDTDHRNKLLPFKVSPVDWTLSWRSGCCPLRWRTRDPSAGNSRMVSGDERVARGVVDGRCLAAFDLRVFSVSWPSCCGVRPAPCQQPRKATATHTMHSRLMSQCLTDHEGIR